MKITVFRVGCMAGYALYLVQVRSNRVVLILGDPLSFAFIRSNLDTDNPFTAGCFGWERYIDPNEALQVCLDWICRWLLGGADLANIPVLMVVHLEPCSWAEGGVRTAVHWAVSNVHLGINRAFRPYVHWREFQGLVTWQDTLNRLRGWLVPSMVPSKVRFFQTTDPVSRDVIQLIRSGLNGHEMTVESKGSLLRKMQELVDIYNKDQVWDYIAEDHKIPAFTGPAIISMTPDDKKYYIKLPSGRTIQICSLGSNRRGIAAAACERARERACGNGDTVHPDQAAVVFAELARERETLFTNKFGNDWRQPAPVPDSVRRYLLEPRLPNSPAAGVTTPSKTGILAGQPKVDFGKIGISTEEPEIDPGESGGESIDVNF